MLQTQLIILGLFVKKDRTAGFTVELSIHSLKLLDSHLWIETKYEMLNHFSTKYEFINYEIAHFKIFYG